ncbi:MAG: class I SAM-dependent methyltransferase [Chlamydiia bacterium]|nr:class I SAM-dependent methyltransferase [Chlamydiia bacterium]
MKVLKIRGYPILSRKKGHQVFHLCSQNSHFNLCKKSKDFASTFLSEATPLSTDADILRFASDAVSIDGMYLEMGVWMGKTINFLAALNPNKVIHGFDSFQGLPHDWEREDGYCPKETFSLENLPLVLQNVTLYKGWFNKTLPTFKKGVLQNTPIALLHIDCDLYSSTADVFNYLGENIVKGTVIIFDELYNFPGFEEHELKAFSEFCEKKNVHPEYLAYNVYHQQVVVQF